MTPTLVTDRDGKAVAAFGGQGGRMIPNGTFDALLHYVTGGRGLVDALEARSEPLNALGGTVTSTKEVDERKASIGLTQQYR